MVVLERGAYANLLARLATLPPAQQAGVFDALPYAAQVLSAALRAVAPYRDAGMALARELRAVTP